MRYAEMKVRVGLRDDNKDTAQGMADLVGFALQALPQEWEGAATVEVLEPRTVKLPESWVSLRGLMGADRLPADAAGVIREALAKWRRAHPDMRNVDNWRVLEFLLADWLGGK